MLAIIRAEVGRLTTTLTMATGAAADALMAKLAESQERHETLASQDVDPAALG